MALDDRNPPPGTGQSINKSGEELSKEENEPGHHGLGGSGKDRPAGGSTARAGTSVDPQEPVDPASPKLPTP